MTRSSNPCTHFLPWDCENFVRCVLELKGYDILEYDEWGYDIRARYPGGVYDYYIEVKCGPGARLSPFQREFRDSVIMAREEFDIPVKFVLCQFDDKGNLIADNECRRLLRPYI